jgi:hypothetical protein
MPTFASKRRPRTASPDHSILKDHLSLLSRVHLVLPFAFRQCRSAGFSSFLLHFLRAAMPVSSLWSFSLYGLTMPPVLASHSSPLVFYPRDGNATSTSASLDSTDFSFAIPSNSHDPNFTNWVAVVCLRVSLGILGLSAPLLIFFLSQPELITV